MRFIYCNISKPGHGEKYLFISIASTSCVDKDYDDLETANVDPALTATHTIKQIQSFATGLVGVEITTDVIIAGVVIGDDSSGNIYKSLILQQDSAGISIQLDISNFSTEYKVGRRIFVKCKGLFIASNDKFAITFLVMFTLAL